MKFEELKKTFWEASYLVKEHEATCTSFQNAFMKDFPLCSLYSCEAMSELRLALMFVNTTLIYRTSGAGHEILKKLHSLIVQGIKEYAALSQNQILQYQPEIDFA